MLDKWAKHLLVFVYKSFQNNNLKYGFVVKLKKYHNEGIKKLD